MGRLENRVANLERVRGDIGLIYFVSWQDREDVDQVDVDGRTWARLPGEADFALLERAATDLAATTHGVRFVWLD